MRRESIRLFMNNNCLRLCHKSNTAMNLVSFFANFRATDLCNNMTKDLKIDLSMSFESTLNGALSHIFQRFPRKLKHSNYNIINII